MKEGAELGEGRRQRKGTQTRGRAREGGEGQREGQGRRLRGVEREGQQREQMGEGEGGAGGREGGLTVA